MDSPVNLPKSGIKLGSPALQEDYLPAKPGSPELSLIRIITLNRVYAMVGGIKRIQQCCLLSVKGSIADVCEQVQAVRRRTGTLEVV